MQTLKTAAIVVLLMTVMYGAYVSLTTPPEPLPADVEEMLVASEGEALAIDVGLPASLGEMEFGESVSFPDSAAANDPSALAFPAVPSANPMSAMGSQGTATSLNAPPVVASLTDSPPGAASAFGGPADAVRLPEATPGEIAATAEGLSRDYPVTAGTFNLPDPNDVAFDADAPSPLALTSGTADTPPAALGSTPIGADGAPQGITMSSGLSNAIQAADRQYAEDKRKEALATLSLFYNSPSMTGEERSALLARLDPLARDVIYSTRHLLEQPYRVGQNETLMDVATRFEVPWQLLANINQISDPVTILPGTELKVVRGPFRAEVNLTLKELTLFLGDLYAGRFPVGIGNDPPPKPGTFTVQDKQLDRTYYNAAGTPVPPGSRDNPYGKVWLDLGGQLCIHGSPNTTTPTENGCISLAGDYAEDLFGILTQGSSVTIRR